MSQTMEYKGYNGSVLYSAEDRLLHGKILGIRDVVIYDGADIPKLEKNFRGAVGEYLEFCKAEGRTPNKPVTGEGLSKSGSPSSASRSAALHP